jgi:hypothetical protein
MTSDTFEWKDRNRQIPFHPLELLKKNCTLPEVSEDEVTPLFHSLTVPAVRAPEIIHDHQQINH